MAKIPQCVRDGWPVWVLFRVDSEACYISHTLPGRGTKQRASGESTAAEELFWTKPSFCGPGHSPDIILTDKQRIVTHIAHQKCPTATIQALVLHKKTANLCWSSEQDARNMKRLDHRNGGYRICSNCVLGFVYAKGRVGFGCWEI